MARTALPAAIQTVDPTSSIASTIATFAATETAVDGSNFNTFANTGHELIVLRNSDASTHTAIFYDVNSVALATITLAAGKSYAFGPFPQFDFGATVKVDVSDATVKATVVGWNPLNIVTG